MHNPSSEIKALIFDFGGVLMRTESSEPRERLARELGLSLEELYATVFDCEESRLVQLGLIAPETGWEQIRQQLGLSSLEEALAFRRVMFAGDVLDTELVSYVRRWHGRYKTALLSNATIRLASVLRDELHITDCFDVIVISAQVGLMKPDPAIFQLTLDQLQVEPQEAVFIDDALVNVEAAAAMGIHAIHFTTPEALLTELEALLGNKPGFWEKPGL